MRVGGMNEFFFFNDTATTEIYTLSLHDALPISRQAVRLQGLHGRGQAEFRRVCRADAQGWKDPARLRRPEGVRRHLGGERTPAPDAGRPPADVWGSGAAPRCWNGGTRRWS